MSKRFFNGPLSDNQTLIQRAVFYARKFCPLRDTQRLAPKREHLVLPGVFVLLLGCSPPAIIRAIPRIIFNAFNTVFGGGARTHIVEKNRKDAPLAANGNAPATVPGVRGVIGVLAPLKHTSPCEVFRRPVRAVNRLRGPSMITLKTPTRLSVAGTQVRAGSNCTPPADTRAAPFDLAILCARHRADNNQPRKNTAREIFGVFTDSYKFHVRSIAQNTQLTADIVSA